MTRLNSKKNEHLGERIQAYLTEHPNARIEHLRLNSKSEQVNTEYPTLIVYDECVPFTIEHFEQAMRILNSKRKTMSHFD